MRSVRKRPRIGGNYVNSTYNGKEKYSIQKTIQR